jgi:hypothetical protein
MGYFDPRLPDPGSFLERILPPTKMSRASFSLHLEIGIARKYSGIHTVAEIRKGYEMKLGNTVSVHDSRHYYYYYY